MNQRDFNPGKNCPGVGEEGRREMGSSEAGDRIKEFVEDVSNKATPYMKTAVHTVREAATPAIQAAKEAAAPALQAAKVSTSTVINSRLLFGGWRSSYKCWNTWDF